ncbi:MAG: hypothetical protein ACOCY1_05440 [Halovenus sp.]
MPRSESVLLLGFYHPRYVEPLQTWAKRLRAVGCSVTEGYPDTWYPEDVLEALATARDLVVYFGHGEPGAWTGLGRIEAADLAAIDGDPHRVVLHSCCHAFDGEERSIAGAFLSAGLAEWVVGYDRRVHTDTNRTTLDRLLEKYRLAAATGGDPAGALRESARDHAPLAVESRSHL